MLDKLSKTAKRKLNKTIKYYLIQQGYTLNTSSTLQDKLQLFVKHNPNLTFESADQLSSFLKRNTKSSKTKSKSKTIKPASGFDMSIYTKKSDKQFFRSAGWNRLRRFAYRNYRRHCMRCNTKSNICVAHIHKRHDKPELQLDKDNVQLLCRDCIRLPETFGVDYRTSASLRYDADKADIKYFR